jgi:hypothetical protein
VTIWTIGHSSRPLEDFLVLLASYAIENVADVRSFPGSRRYPQYGKAELSASLAERGLGYQWLPPLGGRRRVSPNSPNSGWRNASFRGYADYMARVRAGAATADRSGILRTHRDHVCRSAVVALPSLLDCRRPDCAWDRGDTYPRCPTQRRSSDDIASTDRARRVELRCGRTRVIPGDRAFTPPPWSTHRHLGGELGRRENRLAQRRRPRAHRASRIRVIQASGKVRVEIEPPEPIRW